MPAPLILEGLAQTGGILVGEANQFQEKVILAQDSEGSVSTAKRCPARF